MEKRSFNLILTESISRSYFGESLTMGNLKWQDFRHSPMVLSFARSSFVYHHHLSAWRHGTQMCHFVWHKLLVFKKKVSPEKKMPEKTMPDKKTSPDASYLSSKRSFALRLSLEVRRGGVVAGRSHKSKMVQFSSQLLPECTHSVFCSKRSK